MELCHMKEEHRLTVFENRILKGTFGPNTGEESGELRKMHNGGLHYLYFS
jgi:hypothetical protein